MVSDVFFKMVISQLDSEITATMENKCWAIQCNSKVFYCNCCVYYLLRSILKPFGFSVSNFKIQKFSLSISRWVKVSLNLEVLLTDQLW